MSSPPSPYRDTETAGRGNALVTSINVVNSQTGSTKRPPNILYAGFREDFVMGKLMEYATIAVFNFPAGHAARQCRFQLVSDAGDNVGGKPDIYNVFALKPHVGGISPNATTWFNRPERGVALATFTLDYRRIVESTANGKSLHGFLFGPGGAASAETLGKPFACPPVAGQIAYEVAGAVRNKGAGGAMNIGGHSGLGIGSSPSLSSPIRW